MSKIEAIKCDVCGKELKEGEPYVYMPIFQKPITLESFLSTNDSTREDIKGADYCSLLCCEAAFDRAMVAIWGNGETHGVTE